MVCDPPELSTDVFVSVLKQQDGCLVDLDGPVLSSRRAGVINIGLVKHKGQQCLNQQIKFSGDQVIGLAGMSDLLPCANAAVNLTDDASTQHLEQDHPSPWIQNL